MRDDGKDKLIVSVTSGSQQANRVAPARQQHNENKLSPTEIARMFAPDADTSRAKLAQPAPKPAPKPAVRAKRKPPKAAAPIENDDLAHKRAVKAAQMARYRAKLKERNAGA